MRLPVALAIPLLATVAATPASAAVVIIAENIDFATTPFTFGVNAADRFTFTFAPQSPNDPSPVTIRTSGDAAVSSLFGRPTVFVPRNPALFGPSNGVFSSFPTDARANFTSTPSDIGLRFTEGADQFFGYARFSGSTLIQVAFETSPNTAIRAGSAVPEPGTWAMMLLGFGAIGWTMRRQTRVKISKLSTAR